MAARPREHAAIPAHQQHQIGEEFDEAVGHDEPNRTH